jgi:hypothetical protein
MDKGIIYYTDNNISGPIFEKSQETILASGLPIVSCSLKPIDFGSNIFLGGYERSYPTKCLQILTALKASRATYVFFCEHDVLYHPSHFDFYPYKDDVYFYNVNNWRWWFKSDSAISYDGLTSLSMMCCNRELAIKHYEYRLNLIEEQGLDKIRSREPRWARRFGYEPGTKPKRRGGVTDETHIKWRSEYPNVDIRHSKTFSAPKITLKSFKHPPENWKERVIEDIEGWNLREVFGLNGS